MNACHTQFSFSTMEAQLWGSEIHLTSTAVAGLLKVYMAEVIKDICSILSNFAFNVSRDMQITAAYKRGWEKHPFWLSPPVFHIRRKRCLGLMACTCGFSDLGDRAGSLEPGVWHFRTLASPNSTVVSACLYPGILEGWGRKMAINPRPAENKGQYLNIFLCK